MAEGGPAKHEVREHRKEIELAQEEANLQTNVKATWLDSDLASTWRTGSRPIKEVYWVRHGQGFHNLGHGCSCGTLTGTDPRPCPYLDPVLLDPVLTDVGKQQAVSLQPVAAKLAPEVVLVSPLMRTLQTATLAFRDAVPGVPFIAVEDLREENGVHTPDKRSPISVVAPLFPHVRFDGLEDQDIYWTQEREDKKQLADRGARFLKYLADRPENRVAVVTHSAFLLALFSAVLDLRESPDLARWFDTGEMRATLLQFPAREPVKVKP